MNARDYATLFRQASGSKRTIRPWPSPDRNYETHLTHHYDHVAALITAVATTKIVGPPALTLTAQSATNNIALVQHVATQSLEPADMITLSPQPAPITRAEDTPALPQRPPDYLLCSVNGDQDLAIATLLGMSDPDYVSQPLSPPEQREPIETELDEQLTRCLMLEEEQASQHHRGGWGGGGDETRRYDSTAQVGNPLQRDTMAEFQDEFNKIAETGKKIFSSIVQKSKRRCKSTIWARDRPGFNWTSRQDTQPTWGQASQSSWSSGQPHTNTSSQVQYQPLYHDPTLQPQEPYYDPNPPGETQHIPPNPATKPIPNSTSIASNSPTYTGSSTYSPPTTGMGMLPPPELAQRSGDIPRPPSTGAGTPSGINPFLPSHRDDSDDELENPFEDRGQ
ncbi:hypothetical protein DFH29DRAFT_880306 [Suillus ampliporus]|nr:hypothetical protein DFH29DRAFT_880306 [Suillus ampliporus]